MSKLVSEKVPEGYKQTEVGVIPEDWDIALGEDITKLIGKGASPRWQGFTYSSSGMLFVTSENVRAGFLDISVPKYLPLEFHEKLQRSKLQNGDILINLVGASIGRSCQIRQELGEANINQAVAVFRVREPYCAKYAACYFQSPACIDRILGMQVDAARPNISLGDLRNFKIPIPLKKEQTSIANALSDVDALIISLEKLIAKKQAIKKATMQQLLTGKKRLPPFDKKHTGYKQTELGDVPEDWGISKLGDIGKFKNGVNKDGDSFGFGKPFINLMDVFEKSSIEGSENLGLINSSELDRKEYSVKRGDVLFIRSSVKPSGVGLTSVVFSDLTETIYSGFLIRYRSNDCLDVRFKEFCFHENNFRKRLVAASSVSANTNINQDSLKQLLITYPSRIDEQIAISSVLSSMDDDISEIEKRLNKTKQLKQAMMQELLTGRTRLV